MNHTTYLTVFPYIYLLALNLISNYAILIYDKSNFAIWSVLALSACTVCGELLIYRLLPSQILRKLFLTLIIIVHNLFCLVDYFLIINFQTIIGQDIVDIIAETTPTESTEFINAYITLGTISAASAIVIICNYTLYKLSRYLEKLKYTSMVFGCLCIVGILLCSYTAFNFIQYKNGMSVPQFTSITRGGYAYYIMSSRVNEIRELNEICKKNNYIKTKNHSIVVVIGESFSRYRSSLYGYDKETNPLLSALQNDSSLVVFNDAVSIDDHTHTAMKSVFSLSERNQGFSQKPLFPACFRAAGYYTALYDNQYFAGEGITFLTNKEISETIFSHRNEHGFPYDGDMVKEIKTVEDPALYIIHLYGQHYTYENRYPQSFQKFKADDYDIQKYPVEQREIMAHYDNATLYNDHVLNEIIQIFRNKDCCIVYFSDHGEEVFEIRDYMGHGNAAHSPNPDYQIRVPFMVWMSPSFRQNNLEVVQRLKKATDYHITTDDLSHFLIDLAGIETKEFNPERSFINERYNPKKERIVLHSINIDK